MDGFGRMLGRLVNQRYMLAVMCGRSTYKLTWEESRFTDSLWTNR
jgi:hypothetical protein